MKYALKIFEKHMNNFFEVDRIMSQLALLAFSKSTRDKLNCFNYPGWILDNESMFKRALKHKYIYLDVLINIQHVLSTHSDGGTGSLVFWAQNMHIVQHTLIDKMSAEMVVFPVASSNKYSIL